MTPSRSDPTPTTEAGRRPNEASYRLMRNLTERFGTFALDDPVWYDLEAIEAQARAEAWNEGNGLGFREGHRKGHADALREAAERVRALITFDGDDGTSWVTLIAVLAILTETER